MERGILCRVDDIVLLYFTFVGAIVIVYSACSTIHDDGVSMNDLCPKIYVKYFKMFTYYTTYSIVR